MKVKVLFVCMGNICRSPMAEGAFSHLVQEHGFGDRIQVDSAGTTAYHAGESPDPRGQQEAARRGISIGHQRSRGVEAKDFKEFDYIIAMDHMNMMHLRGDCPEEHHAKLHLCTRFAPQLNVEEVPDPYYGGKDGFAEVFDLVQASAEGLLKHIRENHFQDEP